MRTMVNSMMKLNRAQMKVFYIPTTVKEYFYLGAVPLVSVICFIILYFNFSKQEHFSAIQNELSNMETSMVKAESAERGFIITGNRAYLIGFELHSSLFRAREKELCELVDQRPGNKELCNQLQRTAESRLQDMKQVVELAKSGQPQKAEQMIRRVNSLQQMEDIQNTINGIWINNLDH